MALPTERPKYLYKFRSFPEKNEKKEYSLDIIRNNQIFLASTQTLNDPFELKINYHLGDYDFDQSFAKKMDRKFGRESTKEYLADFVKSSIWHNGIREKVINNICTFSCSKISESRVKNGTILTPEDNLLFSHYSQGHKGFCIEFKDLVSYFRDGDQFGKVSYQDKCPVVDVSKPEDQVIPDILDAFRVKQVSWTYEREWRLSVDRKHIKGKQYTPTENGVLSEIPDSTISSIILGCKCSKKNEARILSIVKNKPINVYKAVEHESQYALILSVVNQSNYT